MSYVMSVQRDRDFLVDSIACRKIIVEQHRKRQAQVQQQQASSTTEMPPSKCGSAKGGCGSKESPGFQPSVWGPGLWMFLHVISLNYPAAPTRKDKARIAHFLYRLADVLPCEDCSSHFRAHLASSLHSEDLESRESLFAWMHAFHNKVNRRLGKSYGPSPDEASKAYSRFQSGRPPLEVVLLPLEPSGGAHGKGL